VVGVSSFDTRIWSWPTDRRAISSIR
jgi:hypothetical protein